MRLGIYQFNPRFGAVSENLDRIEGALKDADADLVVLPELCTTGYQFRDAREAFDLAEPVPDGESTRRLEKLAKQKDMFIVAGLAEKSGKNCYNSAVLIGPDGVVGVYRKIHLFYLEKEHFLTGDLDFQVWDVGIAKIGMMVCFDWIFPESAGTLAKNGADIICHPANLVLPYCPDAMITRSIENKVFSSTANRVGTESRIPGETLTYIGSSQVVDPSGKRLFSMGRESEDLQVAEIDVGLARNKQIHKKNHLWQDRRPEFYAS